MKKKNVIQFLNYNAPYKGNFLQSLLHLEELLKSENIVQVYVFQKRDKNISWTDELMQKGHIIYFVSGEGFKSLLSLKKIVKKHNVKIIHTHFFEWKSAIWLNIYNKFFDKNVFLIRHLHNPYYAKSKSIEFIKNKFINFHLTIGCSKAVAEHYLASKIKIKEKVTYVTNAIDFTRLNTFQALNRKSFRIPEDNKLLLVFGFDYFRKGIDLVIRAVDELQTVTGKFTLLISVAANKSFIEDKILSNYSTMPSWIKIVDAREDIASYYRYVDVFISSSRSEGFCYSLVEAAYCGTPIIASRILAQKDLNIPFTFEFEVEDVEDLKEKILKSISLTAEEKENFARIQKEYVVNNFKLNTWSKGIFENYETISNN